MATNYNHIAYSKSSDGKEGFSTLYPNLNLEKHTAQLIGEDNKLIWGSFGANTKTIAYEEVTILDGIAVAGSKTLSSKVENLKPNTSYTIQVKQVSGEEESDFSDSVTFRTNVQR